MHLLLFQKLIKNLYIFRFERVSSHVTYEFTDRTQGTSKKGLTKLCCCMGVVEVRYGYLRVIRYSNEDGEAGVSWGLSLMIIE